MSDYIMVSSPTVQSDLVTKTDYVVYIPLATDKTYGSVKVGEGLKIDYGVISLDRTEIPILSISKNGEPLFPDEFKNVDIPLTKNDVGLSEVDNTSDEDKPVSTLQQIEFDKKLNIHQGVELRNMTLYVNDNGDISFRKQSNDLIVKENDKTIISDANALRFNNFFTVKSVGKEVVIDGSEKLTSFFETVEYDSGTGVLSFTRYNGEMLKIDLPLELIVESGYYNEDSQQIVLILANGGVIEIPVSSLLDDFYSKNEIDSLFAQQEHVAIGDIPDASENVLGKVVLYVGETNDKYVKGDLYKCVSWTNYAIEPAETSYYWVDLNNSLYIMPATAHGYEGRIVRYIGESNDKYTHGKFYEYYDTGVAGSFGGEFRESKIYATKEMVDAKQDKLTAGENITIDENNVISATGGGGGLTIADLPKFVNKIYVDMSKDTSLGGLLSLPCVESLNFIVAFPDGTSQEYTTPTTLIQHQFTNTSQAGWICIYGDWKGIAYLSKTDARTTVLQHIVYDNNITEIPANAFYYSSILTAKLPDTITAFRDRAFYSAEKLYSLNIPEQLEEMETYALAYTKLTELTMPAKWATKGHMAGDLIISHTPITKLSFTDTYSGIGWARISIRGNTTLKEIVFPPSFTGLGGMWFQKDAGYGVVEKITLLGGLMSAFGTINGVLTILVPYSYLKHYKTATNWTKHANIIYPIGGNCAETITIPSTAWDSATNTATVEAVGATSEARNVITWFTSSGGSQVENTYGLKCTAQGTMSLTFSCETIPTEDIEVSVSYMLTNY